MTARTAEARLRISLAMVSGFALGYLLPGTLRLPVPNYDPLAHAWHVGLPAGPAMRYPGDLLLALVAGAVAGLVRARTLRAPAASSETRPADATSLCIATASALALIGLDLAYYLSRLLAAV